MLLQRSKVDVLVFKTNIKSEDELQQIAVLLGNDPNIFRWSIDTDDIDNVLRIESAEISPGHIIAIIEQAGFICNELTD